MQKLSWRAKPFRGAMLPRSLLSCWLPRETAPVSPPVASGLGVRYLGTVCQSPVSFLCDLSYSVRDGGLVLVSFLCDLPSCHSHLMSVLKWHVASSHPCAIFIRAPSPTGMSQKAGWTQNLALCRHSCSVSTPARAEAKSAATFPMKTNVGWSSCSHS